jgi:hypothetical protein
MHPRLIGIEVEVGDGIVFEIMEETDDFWISLDYYLEGEWDNMKLSSKEKDKLRKRIIDDLKWVILDIKKVSEDLSIKAPHFALHFDFCPLGPREPLCIVDKRKEVVYVRLPITFVEGQVCIDVNAEDYDYILYHELMHAKDSLEGRFPSCGLIDPYENVELALITSLWHFSIEGRLEKLNKPHYELQKVIEAEYSFMKELSEIWMTKFEKPITREFFEEFGNKLWGKEVTFQELQSLLSSALTKFHPKT